MNVKHHAQICSILNIQENIDHKRFLYMNPDKFQQVDSAMWRWAGLDSLFQNYIILATESDTSTAVLATACLYNISILSAILDVLSSLTKFNLCFVGHNIVEGFFEPAQQD